MSEKESSFEEKLKSILLNKTEKNFILYRKKDAVIPFSNGIDLSNDFLKILYKFNARKILLPIDCQKGGSLWAIYKNGKIILGWSLERTIEHCVIPGPMGECLEKESLSIEQSYVIMTIEMRRGEILIRYFKGSIPFLKECFDYYFSSGSIKDFKDIERDLDFALEALRRRYSLKRDERRAIILYAVTLLLSNQRISP